MNLDWSVRGESNFVVDKTGFIWQIWKKKLKMKRITQSSMNFKCQVGLMKVVTYQFISKSPAEVN